LSHAFSGSGVHSVELRVTDATEAEHRLERTVGIPPEAAFTYACANATRTCDFDAAATSDGVVSFRYELGDGTIQEGAGDPGAVIVRHGYATSGRFDVTLVVWDGDGQEDSVTHEVNLTPVPDFAASCSPETRTCELDASISSPLMTLYDWSFGDGSRGTGVQAAHTYATSGVYTVVLTVVDPAGQIEAVAKPVALLPRAAFSVQCDPEARTCTFDGSASTPGVSHGWDFGDGTPVASGPVQEHTYPTSGLFTVTLTVTDASGQTASSAQSVVIPPVAAFTVSCDSLRCAFDAGGSSPGVTLYTWSFGHDGQSGAGVAPIHVFPDAGEYDVSLTVRDGAGQTVTTTRTVSVANEELFLLLLLDRR
jgi:PKD repeat protein